MALKMAYCERRKHNAGIQERGKQQLILTPPDLVYSETYGALEQLVADLFPEAGGKVVLSLGYLVVCWLFLWLLYRKKVFLKV